MVFWNDGIILVDVYLCGVISSICSKSLDDGFGFGMNGGFFWRERWMVDVWLICCFVDYVIFIYLNYCGVIFVFCFWIVGCCFFIVLWVLVDGRYL